MYCLKCGNEIKDQNATFCNACGAPVQNGAAPGGMGGPGMGIPGGSGEKIDPKRFMKNAEGEEPIEFSMFWIRAAKTIATIVICLIVFIGLVVGIGGCAVVTGESNFGLGLLVFILAFIVCTVSGFVTYIFTMLIVNIAANLQCLRHKQAGKIIVKNGKFSFLD